MKLGGLSNQLKELPEGNFRSKISESTGLAGTSKHWRGILFALREKK